MSERVHPSSHSSPEDSPDSPRSSSAANFVPKPSPPPGDYIIQIPKDHIYRQPPPQNAALFASYTRRTKRRPRSCCCRLLCYLLAAAAILAVLLAAAAGILYFVFRPKVPSYSLAALSVNGFNVSVAGAAPLSPEFDATVRAENPNGKIGIYYRSGSDISVSYNGARLCSGSWPEFFQPRRNVTLFQSKLIGSDVTLSSEERRSLVAAQANRVVPLEVDFKVPVKIKLGAVTTWTITVKVECDVTVSDLKSDSDVVSQKCKVKVHI